MREYAAYGESQRVLENGPRIDLSLGYCLHAPDYGVDTTFTGGDHYIAASYCVSRSGVAADGQSHPQAFEAGTDLIGSTVYAPGTSRTIGYHVRSVVNSN
ncbi:hypothetical protein LRS13_01975 [Svornostia abyssi]|uniref:Uncharacterized protein n=1 Tax=Svornostia abyssi TaxID=2898438 RepID=A0ABY5PI89_9ACTN|nr:hypothetical protein LRS13_01975 [Parviterribacteraceae bacterium J379]